MAQVMLTHLGVQRFKTDCIQKVIPSDTPAFSSPEVQVEECSLMLKEFKTEVSGQMGTNILEASTFAFRSGPGCSHENYISA